MTKQVVEPRMRGFISLTAHPDGCAAQVRGQVEVARASGPGEGIGTALVIGSSTGYGLASLLTAVFGYGANAVGVCLERPSEEEKGGSAGWYNLAEAHRLAVEAGRRIETVNIDAFSAVARERVLRALKDRFGRVDLLVYSLAAPRRQEGDERWDSVLKPIGQPYVGKTVDLRRHTIAEARIDPAEDEEVWSTVKVMGGEDWASWVHALREADLIADGCRTVAYSYIGPEVTQAIYRQGTIGVAKADLERTAGVLRGELAPMDASAWVSINKAVVTQASAVIPGVALYMSILFKLMKEAGTHEGPIEQIARLLRDHLAPGRMPATDEEGRIRLDDLEMRPDIQAAVAEAWDRIDSGNLAELSDYAGYRRYFEELFGFGVVGIDYAAPTEVHRELVLPD